MGHWGWELRRSPGRSLAYRLPPAHGNPETQHFQTPVRADDKFATGTVFNDSKDSFVITQNIEGAEPVTAPAKFLFASDGAIIYTWTERKGPDGTFDRSGEALAVIDQSREGSQFFGLAISSAYARICAANFGVNPDIKMFDGKFRPLPATFETPFDGNQNG